MDFELIIFTALKPAWLVWRKKNEDFGLGSLLVELFRFPFLSFLSHKHLNWPGRSRDRFTNQTMAWAMVEHIYIYI